MPLTRTPTGRRRYRIEHRWRKPDLLVLQIEERPQGERVALTGLRFFETVDWREWRDATVLDFTTESQELAEKGRANGEE